MWHIVRWFNGFDYPSVAKCCVIKDIESINAVLEQFAMTGWRVEYVMAEKDWAMLFFYLQQNYAVYAPTPSLYTAVGAIAYADKNASVI